MAKFTETQRFTGWAYAVLGLTALISLGSLAAAPRLPAWLWLYVGLSLTLVVNLLCLRTTVTESDLVVAFGALFPLYRRRIALADIASAESVTYSPVADYGGWGIRGWGRSVALNARGSLGVRVTLQDGRRVLIGSQRPEELAEALAARS